MEYVSKQYMPSWLLLILSTSALISILIVVGTGYAELVDFMNGVEDSSKGAEVFYVLIGLIVLHVTFGILFTRLPLTVRINHEGITYMCAPYLRSPKKLAWVDIQEITVKEISPLGDFGGWGYRMNGAGKGYVMASGPALLISTPKHKNTFVLTVVDGEGAKRAIAKYQASLLKQD